MSGTFEALVGVYWGPVTVFLQVVLIDLVLAGDNAVAVGLAASGLGERERRRVIFAGLGAAVVLRLGLALVALQLLSIIGLTLAGGILLLLVCYKMWSELRKQGHAHAHAHGAQAGKTFGQSFFQILAADISMSLDNVLAVAGAAHRHPAVLFFGLALSIVLMGIAANAISRILDRVPWIGYLGVAIVLYVALHMMWEGYRGVVVDLHEVRRYNAIMPDWLDINPREAAGRR
ncbi:MAG TPA: TerC family protein [Caulobacteraceae bacterium]|jgi:YjbE family integral membrane protein|nr:TerC family protein [Caulobacteraceae bacterium]